jgi:hypothetical protein
MHLLLSETFFFPPLPDSRNFRRGGSVDLFWNNPLRLAHDKHRVLSQLHLFQGKIFTRSKGN